MVATAEEVALTAALGCSAERHVERRGGEVAVDHAARELRLRVVELGQAHDRDRVRLHVEHDRDRRARAGAGEPVVVPEARRALERVDLRDRVRRVRGERLRDVELPAPAVAAHPAAVAPVLRRAHDLRVQAPDRGQARRVVGHHVVDDDHLRVCPADVGCPVEEAWAVRRVALRGGHDVLYAEHTVSINR